MASTFTSSAQSGHFLVSATKSGAGGDSDLIELAVTAFKELVNGDVTEFGKQQPDFAEKRLEVLGKALAQVEKDEQSRSEYEKN